MRIYDIIDKKKNGYELNNKEIDYFVQEYTRGNIEDYQASALLMAIFINGMTESETISLTNSMTHSGEILSLNNVIGETADKHSTGGVGDKTSLIVAPICASVGVKMAKMSGRGLGHTGGTIDKLESIDGYNTSLSTEDFIKQVNDIGIAIIGQTANLAPADKKLYALRDVTATIDSIPLIAASIMSKKLAAGAHNIVLDVKCGNGAFMNDISSAKKLAELMVKIGKSNKRNTIAEITNMNIPLGKNIGNALEIKEVIDILKNNGDEDLKKLCLSLSSNILKAAYGLKEQDALMLAKESLESGNAFRKFRELVERQGGNIKEIDNPDLLPKAKYNLSIKATQNGYIKEMNSEYIGKCCVVLGAGREKIGDKIDYGAGIILKKKTYDYVNTGDTIAILFTNNKDSFKTAKNIFSNAISYSENKMKKDKLIYEIIS